jgi:hypothetical protein
MPLNKIDQFIKNTDGRTLYVNPSDLNSTDGIENDGTSLSVPFKTLQRALLESARFSYLRGSNNDITEKTTILLFPGEHLVDNRPGFAVYDNGGVAFAVSRAGGTGALAASVLSLGPDSVFDLTQEDNLLYKFNSFYGGVIVPRGTSIVGLDLRKTKIRPKYIPNPLDTTVPGSALFRITGACYFWQFSMFDGDETGLVYTNPDNFSPLFQSAPTFSHHKLTCFEYADGVNNIGTYGLTDLDMYYSKLSNAYNQVRNIDQKFPADPEGFAKQRPEWEIVGAFASDPIEISNIISGNGSIPNSVITVTTTDPHQLNSGTPIKIRGVSGSGVVAPYNIAAKVQNVLSDREFTYLLPDLASYPNLNANPSAASATVTIETDTVSGASPYIFNVSLRSVWGMNGLLADGYKASGFRSVVVAQFTAVSLQKDDRAFVKYDKQSRTYQGVTLPTSAPFPYGAALAQGSSETNSERVYHLDPDAIYRRGWETSHIKMTNDAFIQIVSVFAIGFNKHFDAESGGDASITNSNSNFGQISLNSSGFKREAFEKDNNSFITSIISPRAIDTNTEEQIDWLSLNVGLTTQVGISSHLYIFGFTSADNPPSTLTQGYRIGARKNDKLYIVGSGTTYSSDIYMTDNVIGAGVTALGTTSSAKVHPVISGPVSNTFTTTNHNIQTGEKIVIHSVDGDLPENIIPNRIYYAIRVASNQLRLASSFTNAVVGESITVYGGTNLVISSRVSDKDSGDIGSPIQFDSVNNNWFIHTNHNNQIYNAFNTLGVNVLSETTDLAFVRRISDERSLDEKIYKLRVVIPKELRNAKDPEAGFVLQTSSSTGARNNADFTRTSIASTDYSFNKNPRFIQSASVAGDVITINTELPHQLQTGDTVKIKNVTSSTNTLGDDNLGYNGIFQITVINDVTFRYSNIDIFGVGHIPGTFTNNVNVRDIDLPRFERTDLQGNLYIYRNEVISSYIEGVQDGIYHLYVLNANNAIPTEFTNLKYSQATTDLYPQLDRDNPEANPAPSKTFAKRSPIGEVVTGDLKKSVTRETTDALMRTVGLGLTIASVDSISGIATITFGRNHGLAGIVTYTTLTGGSGHNNGSFYNVKLFNEVGLVNWDGATAKVDVAGGSVVSADIIAGGSGYTNGETLYFDTSQIGGSVNAFITITNAGISTNIGDVVQFTGAGTTSDTYHRITSVSSVNQISIAKTAGDTIVTSSQYAYVIGPSIRISGTSYNASTGLLTITSSSAHGLLAGNQFRVIDSSNANQGDYIVKDRINTTSFTAVTNRSISATNGFILKHGLSANEAISDTRGENLGTRSTTFYDNETATLTSAVTSQTTLPISTALGSTTNRFTLGSYIQIDNEIMRITSSNNATQIQVLRGAFGTRQENHDSGSLIRKINPVAIEFRRPSIIRASGHTFEYLGYGPGNYSTGLPQVQVKSLTEAEEFLSQSQERSCGVVVYTGMNNKGDFFNGNTKTLASSGEIISYDIPNPTITGENTSKLSVVFDEVTIKERLIVEGGSSGQVLSQFDGPVTFNRDVKIKASTTLSGINRIINETQSTSTTTGALTVAGGVGIGKNLYVGGLLDVVGSANISSNLTVGGNLVITGTVNFNSNVRFGDNDHLYLGDSDDLDLYHDGSNSYIDDRGTGGLILRGNGFIRLDKFTGETMLDATADGAVTAYFNNSAKLATTNDGISVTGQISATDDIIAFASDERLKENIQPLDNALDKVMRLSGFTYNFNEIGQSLGFDGSIRYVGVSAQEVQAVLPEAVKPAPADPNYITVQYEKIVPLLIEAIKELKEEINELKGHK